MTAPNVAPGSVIAGKFSVRSLLGYGGATATFRAVTAQGRDVALKLYSPAIGQRPDVMQQLQRFVAETNNLPPDLAAHVLEAGYDHATAAPFTATDFIPMPSLAQLVMRRPMSAEEVAAVLRTVAAVLDAAHGREVFHHGVKPTNLFVDPSAPGNAKVTDFGAALAQTLLPTSEGYLGAAPWVAPEQTQGAGAGGAADIFSLALVAFFALTGRSYWRSCQSAIDVAAWQHELMSPRALASARGAEIGIPMIPQLDPVFARALAHDPRERFRSATEFAAVFSGFPSMRMEPTTTLALSPSPGDLGIALPPETYGAGGSSGPQDAGAIDAAPAPAMADLGGMGPGPNGSAPFIASPGMTSVVAPPRSAWGRAAPLVVGGAAVLLIGGAAFAWFALGRSAAPATSPSATPSASAAPTQPAATQAPPAESAAPAASDSAPAEPVASAAPAAGDEAPSKDAPVTITCKPAPCDEIAIDSKPVRDLAAELRLTPGMHRVSVKRAGFFPRAEAIVVQAGKPIEKEFELTAIPAGPSAPAGQPAATAKCGKFLKRCK